MGMPRILLALAAIIGTAAVIPASAQRPDKPEEEIIVPPSRSRPAGPKSDEHRVVGKVLEIDREQRLVKLATDEGVVLVEAPALTLPALRVGDTVSVPRPEGESPSASPRR